MSNEFSEYYQTLSNIELLRILDAPGSYMPGAIAAAREELDLRDLSADELNNVEAMFSAEKKTAAERQAKLDHVKNKVTQTGASFFDLINPVQAAIPGPEKICRFIVIIFTGLFLYDLVKDWGTVTDAIAYFFQEPVLCALTLFPFVLLPIAIVQFWRKQKIGWILLAVFLVFSAVSDIWLLTWIFFTESRPGLGRMIFALPSPIPYIANLVFVGGTLYAISKKSIGELFGITQQEVITAISVSAAATVLLLWSMKGLV